MNTLEKVANISLVGASLLVGIQITKNYRESKQNYIPIPSVRGQQRLTGRTLPVAEVTRRERGATLVLILSTHCSFCTSSMGFYKKLVS